MTRLNETRIKELEIEERAKTELIAANKILNARIEDLEDQKVIGNRDIEKQEARIRYLEDDLEGFYQDAGENL
jgi:uncharacterized coiled-coil protein SlyX